MPITSDVINALRCNVYEKDHFLNNAVVLSCGHNACKSCVSQKNGHEFICQFENCSKKHKIKNADSLPVNQTVPVLMQTYKDDILELLKSDFQDSLNDLETVNLESSIDNNCEFIEFEIDLKIESLKAQLDVVGENMRSRLRNLKEEMKSMIPTDQVDAAREFISNIKSFCESPNVDVQEYQDKIKECRKRINNLRNNLPKLPFKTSDADIDEHFIGELNEITLPENKLVEKEGQSTVTSIPGDPVSRFSRMTRSANYSFQSSCLTRLGYIKSKNEVLITDSETGCLTVLDRDTFQQITCVNPKQRLHCPVSLFVNHRNEVLVGDYTSSKVHVFTEDLEYVSSFGEDIIKKPFFITADPETNNVYVSDKRNDTITVWNGETFLFIDNIKCDSPSHMQIVENKIYVVSGLYFELAKNRKKKFERKSKGLNAVLVLDKTTHETLRRIEKTDCFDYRGLYVDPRGVVYAICDEVSYNGAISNKSRLVGISSDDSTLSVSNLDFSNCRDMMVLDNQVIVVRGKCTPPLFVLDFQLAF